MDAMKVIMNLNRCKDGDCDHCDYKRLWYPNSFDDGREVCERERLDNDARALIAWLESMIKEG